MLFGRQVRDFILVPIGKYQPRQEWLLTQDEGERALRRRHLVKGEELTLKTQVLTPLTVVSIQNQRGPHSMCWDNSGVVVECSATGSTRWTGLVESPSKAVCSCAGSPPSSTTLRRNQALSLMWREVSTLAARKSPSAPGRLKVPSLMSRVPRVKSPARWTAQEGAAGHMSRPNSSDTAAYAKDPTPRRQRPRSYAQEPTSEVHAQESTLEILRPGYFARCLRPGAYIICR